jgi:hypothetical protein
MAHGREVGEGFADRCDSTLLSSGSLIVVSSLSTVSVADIARSVIADRCSFGALPSYGRGAHTLGRERGLPGSWLNEQASMYVSKFSDENKAVVFDHPNLIVATASAEHLLVMKMQTARLTDTADLRLLLGVLGISEVEGALRVHETVFPGMAVSDGARLLLEDILNNQGDGNGDGP